MSHRLPVCNLFWQNECSRISGDQGAPKRWPWLKGGGLTWLNTLLSGITWTMYKTSWQRTAKKKKKLHPSHHKIAQINSKTNKWGTFVVLKVSILKSYSTTHSSPMVPFFSKPNTVLGQESSCSHFYFTWLMAHSTPNQLLFLLCLYFPLSSPKVLLNAV